MRSFSFGNMEKRNFIKHLNEKHPTIKFTAEWSQTSINFLNVSFNYRWESYYKFICKAINISTLLHVNHITVKWEFHTAKLCILIESVQTLILYIEDVMVLKSG